MTHREALFVRGGWDGGAAAATLIVHLLKW